MHNSTRALRGIGHHLAVIALFALGGCASTPEPRIEDDPAPDPLIATLEHELGNARKREAGLEEELEAAGRRITTLDTELARERERNERLQREQERLRADLADAESTLVAVESGLESLHSRADAVSLLADARIIVERAARQAPWRAGSVAEAREKIAAAEAQVEAGYLGAAVFFTTRARRIADTVLAEVAMFSQSHEVLAVGAARVNLRDGPSTLHHVLLVLEANTPLLPRNRSGDWYQVLTPTGDVGWIHGRLVTARP